MKLVPDPRKLQNPMAKEERHALENHGISTAGS